MDTTIKSSKIKTWMILAIVLVILILAAGVCYWQFVYKVNHKATTPATTVTTNTTTTTTTTTAPATTVAPTTTTKSASVSDIKSQLDATNVSQVKSTVTGLNKSLSLFDR